MPGRHLALYHLFSNGRGPWAYFLVVHQGHRRDVIRVMARHAVLVKNWCDVLAIRNLSSTAFYTSRLCHAWGLCLAEVRGQIFEHRFILFGFLFKNTYTTDLYTLSLHDAPPA